MVYCSEHVTAESHGSPHVWTSWSTSEKRSWRMCGLSDAPNLEPQIFGSHGSHTILSLVNLLVHSEHSEPINTAGTYRDRENAARSSDGLKLQSE